VKRRVALATYGRAPALAPDDQLLVPALDALDILAEPVVWSSHAMWTAFDAVIIRSCWDYHLHSDAFHAWLSSLEKAGVPVWNPAPIIRWNSDKRYLIELEDRGVPAIHTEIVRRGRVSDVEDVVERNRWKRFVVKPAISASGFETYALDTPLDDYSRATISRVASSGDILVQPFADEIPEHGELSFMFLDGGFSHAALKRAAVATGEFRVQTEHGGTVDRTSPPEHLVEQAARSLAVLPTMPLYARVDGIVRDDQFVLMELELIEPNLFLDLEPTAPERMARGIMRRLSLPS
jgi:glutathione synthase/RimK-type ligase-like ATP-grasp enzyme